ncbi:MAG: Calx-beta domain-containing protein [Coleofasciculus sp. B1-GNL1-01]|uniref:DUF4114 domain-containing protein n=1 Tax=Coleofasciculus sp. B1-GNL1-01 TaxID=3068484 RepID=UPI0032FDFF8B
MESLPIVQPNFGNLFASVSSQNKLGNSPPMMSLCLPTLDTAKLAGVSVSTSDFDLFPLEVTGWSEDNTLWASMLGTTFPDIFLSYLPPENGSSFDSSKDFLLGSSDSVNADASLPFNLEQVDAILSPALQTAITQLEKFTEHPDFLSQMNLAFREVWCLENAKRLIREIVSGETSLGVEIIPLDQLKAKGAFAEDTIYLAREFITQNLTNPDPITTVLLEEVGHYIDSRLNSVDSLGDEGAIFAAIVQNKALTKSELLSLKAENDSALLQLNNQEIQVEQSSLEPGLFTVGETGKVNIDFVFDGGAYTGEVAIFSLAGMEELEQGSTAFIEEAARRALSDSELGYVAISDSTEGARFSGELGEVERNSGDYLGAKTFAMRPGETVAFMLVPNGTVQDVFNNPAIEGDKTPLFSLANANPNNASHVGQIVDTAGEINGLSWEDLRADGNSDSDYNDLIIKVNGATGQALPIVDVIDSKKDWRETGLAQEIIDYLSPIRSLLFTPASPQAVANTSVTDDPEIIRDRLVEVNVERLAEPNQLIGQSLTVNLFEDTFIDVVIERVELSSDESSWIWTGNVPDTRYSEVILVSGKENGIVVGTIRIDDTLYDISFTGNGVHTVSEIDLTTLPSEQRHNHQDELGDLPVTPDVGIAIAGDGHSVNSTDSITLGAALAFAESPKQSDVDDGSIIDVLVVYTEAAREAEGGTDAIRQRIYQVVTETNLGYENSGINQRLRVHIAEVGNYQEVGATQKGSHTELKRLQNPSDGYLDEVHQLRDYYSADMVALWTEDLYGYDSEQQEISGKTGGLAYVLTNPDQGYSFEDLAFSVVTVYNAKFGYSFAHEMGHNQGATHNKEAFKDLNKANKAYPYSFGYTDPDAAFRTIMAYKTNGEARRNFWSNPDLTYQRKPLGLAGQADNRLTLNNTAIYAANWRHSNDNFAHAKSITGSSLKTTALNINATKEADEINYVDQTGDKSVWWSWLAEESGQVTLTTADSDFDTLLGVYTGTSLTNLNVIASNNNEPNGGITSQVTFDAVAGTTYKIAVDGYKGASGHITLNLQQAVPPKVSLTAIDSTATENGKDGQLTLTRTGLMTDSLTVRYAVSGTATNGDDYNALDGTIVIPANQTTVTLPITAINDNLVELDETVVVNLMDGNDYNLGANSSATVTIVSDDVPPPPIVTIAATDANASENSLDTGTFTITRDGDTTQPLTINVQVIGTAQSNSDYMELNSSVTIPTGQQSTTFNLTPIDDNEVEEAETVTVILTESMAYEVGTSNLATVAIASDDVLSATDFNIEFDYRFDTNGFFDAPERRAVLEAAADYWKNIIQDEFADIPAGIQFSVRNPQNGDESPLITLDQPIDDLLIFVGTQSPPFNQPEPDKNLLLRGGFSGQNIKGDRYRSRIANSTRRTGLATNFEPWVGSISFDPTFDWNFSLTPNTDPTQEDFFSATLRGIGFVLGIGTSPIFSTIGQDGFDGVNALAVNNDNPVPLEDDLDHILEDYISPLDNQAVLFDETVPANGVRLLPSLVDLALLADIGYEIDGFVPQGSTNPIATPEDDITIFGTIGDDLLDGLGGDDKIQGDLGDDSVLGGLGKDILLGEEGNDYLFGNEGDDELQGGTEDDFLSGDAGNDAVWGQDGNDQLFGGEGNDVLQGGIGDDSLDGGFGDDKLFGQDGIDTFIFGANNGTDRINDFDVDNEVIQIASGLGFATGEEVLATLTKPYNNVSRFTLSPGNVIEVMHESMTGTPLTAANFKIVKG